MRRSGADAIHPGYGFLSENAAFAAACEDAGIVFIGPTSQVIARMGSKIEARRTMEAAGVPVVPGVTPDDQSDESLRRAALSVGLPVLLKPSAGGGGKGMRLVRESSELDEAIAAARYEAAAAFGDDTLYVERAILRPRHVEVQILGDGQGNAVHLFERDCTVQRRHQKIIEESPSTALTPELRRSIGETSVMAARTVGYRSAGTIEFLLEGQGAGARFYFLEMNTRLQVEHPVTEALCGVDLVRAQLAIASGRGLPWTQDELRPRGHAIECRVYAEDPSRGFIPQAGRILLYEEPHMPGVRIDSGVAEGTDVPVFYDPILAKLIAGGETREMAIRRAVTALRHFPILGVRTNVPFLIRILEHPQFVAGDIDTGFVDRELAALTQAPPDVPAAVLAAVAEYSPAGPQATSGPWAALRGWRSL